jgi:hypothetical protein
VAGECNEIHLWRHVDGFHATLMGWDQSLSHYISFILVGRISSDLPSFMEFTCLSIAIRDGQFKIKNICTFFKGFFFFLEFFF